MNNAEFLAAFENCTIPKEAWKHVDHVRMAWLYLRQMPYDKALEKVRQGIQKLNTSYGNKTGYHETLTCAYCRIIAMRMGADCEESWADFQAHNGDLFDRAQPVTLHYYRKETLLSERATQEFLTPDLRPFK